MESITTPVYTATVPRLKKQYSFPVLLRLDGTRYIDVNKYDRYMRLEEVAGKYYWSISEDLPGKRIKTKDIIISGYADDFKVAEAQLISAFEKECFED